ncbi:MAG: glucose-1-phosphate thymidylyltransferase RfbA [Alphaproteobacteria bacterium]|nr:glucose-1-phosphate thymidylyltransferase RfbA [Alphaproteobacteria bacterium]
MKHRKGIILAGGSGTRLYPATKSISKQLLPIYDKPMIYYPLTTLMLADIQDILIITTTHEQHLFQQLLGDGAQWGISLNYEVQANPEGLPQAFTIGEKFLNGSPCAMILGDNIFYAHKFGDHLQKASNRTHGATVFAHQVSDPNRYGIVEFDREKKIHSIEEKPQNPKSNWAVTGLYFFDENVPSYAKTLRPSARGELEIVDILNQYLKANELHVELMGRGCCWFDAGIHRTMLEASQMVHSIQTHQSTAIACPEEVAFYKKWISAEEVLSMSDLYKGNDYGKYLKKIVRENYYSPSGFNELK